MKTQFSTMLKFGLEELEFADEDALGNYLGVVIEQLPGGGFFVTQPFIIQCILDTITIAINICMVTSQPILFMGPLLSCDEQGRPIKFDHNYRILTSMPKYTQSTSQPGISISTINIAGPMPILNCAIQGQLKQFASVYWLPDTREYVETVAAWNY